MSCLRPALYDDFGREIGGLQTSAGSSDVTDPVTTAVAVAVTTKAVEGLSEAGKAAFKALVRLVRGKLSSGPSATDVLARAQQGPGEARQELIEALRQAAADDVVFHAELRRLWQTVLNERSDPPAGGVVNHVSATVSGTVVQARDVYGGISLGRS